MSNQKETPHRNIRDLGSSLRTVIDREITNLPELIKELPPEQRINVILRLMPYVFPKVNKVDSGWIDSEWVE